MNNLKEEFSHFAGNQNLNVVPFPGSDSSEISPSISSIRFLTIAKPKPAPPYNLVVESLACLKR